MGPRRAPIWLDGALASADAPPPAHGEACYTTARYARGAVRWAAEAAERLARDAAALGLGQPAADLCARALLELGVAAFGPQGEGIVRLEAGRGPSGALRLLGTTRALGAEPPTWSAVVAPACHPGPARAPGAKLAGRAAVEEGRAAARAAGADEALLFDAAGRLVEGARSCLAVALADGRFLTPPLGRGGVRGVARQRALEHGAPLVEADVPRSALGGAREIVALNAVRGARPIVRLDGRPVGDGRPGALARALVLALAQA